MTAQPDGDGWVHVHATDPGAVTVQAEFTLSSVVPVFRAPCS